MSEQFVVVGTAADTTITITREQAAGTHPQGLVCEADHPMTIADTEATRLVLWADTAPEAAEITTSEPGELRIWHVWRDGDLIQAWEGDAHIDVDDEGDDLELRCFDNTDDHEPSLVVRVGFDRAWTQPRDDH